MLSLLVMATPGAVLQSPSLAEVIASTSQTTIGIGKCTQEVHMEDVMWECLTWQLELFNPFHSARTTLLPILDQFGLQLLCDCFSLFSILLAYLFMYFDFSNIVWPNTICIFGCKQDKILNQFLEYVRFCCCQF